MSQPTQLNFGDTISRGIQDVAALLPLLGTDQCERHVGAALEKGYIYASATPLSIFGTLGIVKTAFATFLACTTKVFYGGKWFHHAGFGTSASVTSMVTIASGTKLYGAEVKFEELLKEQHLNDPELIEDVGWFGWEKRSIDNNNDSQPVSVSQRSYRLRYRLMVNIISANQVVFSLMDFCSGLSVSVLRGHQPLAIHVSQSESIWPSLILDISRISLFRFDALCHLGATRAPVPDPSHRQELSSSHEGQKAYPAVLRGFREGYEGSDGGTPA